MNKTVDCTSLSVSTKGRVLHIHRNFISFTAGINDLAIMHIHAVSSWMLEFQKKP